MILVDLPSLAILGPLLAARIEESHIQHRLTMDRALDKIHHLILTNQGAAFTDSLELPTVAIVLQTGISAVFEEKFCNVVLIYVSKETRSLRKALESVKQIEEYARSQKCNVIHGDSWTYRGSDGIGALWKHADFEEQSVTFIKHLTY